MQKTKRLRPFTSGKHIGQKGKKGGIFFSGIFLCGKFAENSFTKSDFHAIVSVYAIEGAFLKRMFRSFLWEGAVFLLGGRFFPRGFAEDARRAQVRSSAL